MRAVYVIGDGKSVAGVRTGNRKMLYLEHILSQFSDGSLRISDAVVVQNPAHADTERTAREATLAEFEKQLRQFKRITYMPRLATGKAHTTVSGKVDEAGVVQSGRRDDMVMALLMCSYWQLQYSLGNTPAPITLHRPY